MRLSNIEATLESGRFYSGRVLKFFWCYFGLLVFLTLFGTFMVLTYSDPIDVDNIIGALCSFILFGGGALAFFVLLRKNKRQEKKITEFLKDAIPIITEVEPVPGRVLIFNGIKIRVSFSYNGKNYIRCSGRLTEKFSDGYDKVFIKYVNRKVKALYSPQYDQVMFVKNENQI